MLTAAQDAVEFVTDFTREDFDEDKKTQFAAARALEILGEAAGKVDEEIRAAHPEIEWRDIIGLRNIIIHQYFRVDLDTVWDIVTNQIPPLIEQLKPIVPPGGGS